MSEKVVTPAGIQASMPVVEPRCNPFNTNSELHSRASAESCGQDAIRAISSYAYSPETAMREELDAFSDHRLSANL
jgi:hypothetical protein